MSFAGGVACWLQILFTGRTTTMNHVILLGRLATNPKFTKYKEDVDAGLPDEKSRFTVFFELGVERKTKASGRDRQDIDWIPVSFFHGQPSKFIKANLRRGDQVAIVGQIEASIHVQSNGTQKKNLRVIGSKVQRIGTIRKDRPKRG